MKKGQSGKFTALVLSACCLTASLSEPVLSQDGSTANGGRTWTADPGPGGSTTPTPTGSASSAGDGASSTGTAGGASIQDLLDSPEPAGSTTANPVNQSTAKPPAKPVHSPAAATPAGKPSGSGAIKGRIEELCSTPGAILPLKALTPKMDNSPPMVLKGGVKESVAGGGTSRLTSGATQVQPVVQSFPIDYRGQWGGTMKVWTAQYGPLAWQFDPDETRQELALLKPGTEGSVTFNFAPNQKGFVTVEPTQVVFTANSAMSTSQLAGQLGGGAGSAQANALAAMLGGGGGSVVIPRMYAMHLGNLSQGVGVTGNALQSRVVKNEIRELKAGVLEQTIVTRDSDTNTKTGKNRQAYSETVLRFTRVNPTQLYVQAASVKYSIAGKYENKIVMYGTVNRGQGSAMGMPGMLPGLGGLGGLGGGANGMGGMGALENMFKEMNRSLGGQ